ncbi:DUF924 family protein [Pseudaestuariivita rosea]|uniref:DUF924 family protein n=1 Tax=Pseudaestuariivita rosea TaxID=2763263 RepID=UPI001ABA2612|nr:DUF924 family protein [Pseudaestuariivita rosea]
MTTPEEILAFWLDEVDQKYWYQSNDALDRQIREKFEQAWQDAMDGTCGLWLTYPSGTLAYIILLDQFPRNMFRGTAKAFASDKHAMAAAKMAVDHGWDMKIDEPARQFFYLPMMHSENLCDQERAVRLILTRMPKTGADNLLHAKAHREVIRRFGRFPYRNEALARETTVSEAAFIDEGGYGATVEALRV